GGPNGSIACRNQPCGRKVEHPAAQGQLARASQPDIIRRLNTVVVDEIGHTLARKWIRRSRDLKVKMGLPCISGGSDLCDNLTESHMISGPYAQAAWLQVT